jgi:hypothetical protein
LPATAICPGCETIFSIDVNMQTQILL